MQKFHQRIVTEGQYIWYSFDYLINLCFYSFVLEIWHFCFGALHVTCKLVDIDIDIDINIDIDIDFLDWSEREMMQFEWVCLFSST